MTKQLSFEEKVQAIKDVGFPDLLLAHEIFSAQRHYFSDHLHDLLWGNYARSDEKASLWLLEACGELRLISEFLGNENNRDTPLANLLPKYQNFKPRESMFFNPDETAGEMAYRIKELANRAKVLLDEYQRPVLLRAKEQRRKGKPGNVLGAAKP